MIAALIMAMTMVAGPALRLGAPLADGAPVILAIDGHGMVAARIMCPRSQWSQPEDMIARLIGSRAVMRRVIETDGHLKTIEDLGPLRHECVLLPLESGT
jgi:hypothetical protein